MIKVAVVLAGCGHLDGAEIRESVITLLELDKAGAEVQCFAPNINQMHVINHLTGEESKGEARNVLVEAARIARGRIKDLNEAKSSEFDALILPGGFGAAKNLSTIAIKGKHATILPEFKELILDFIAAKKPIGAICISPAVLALAVKDTITATVTIGDDDGLIASLNSKHQPCPTDDICVDSLNNIISCPAYMREAALKDVATGIEKLVEKVIELSRHSAV
jgi:enhancing lycopene biosynthesis protein 2